MNTTLDPRLLRAFLVLAKEGSYTRAAKELSLTQSAVSHSMRNLQEQLGCSLLYIVGKKVHLTDQGKTLRRDAEGILNSMDQAIKNLRSEALEDRGRLVIGCSPASAQFILPPVLREFKDCFPRYEIAIRPGDTLDLVDQLMSQSIDLALGLLPPNLDKLEARKLFEDELYFIVSPFHPWASVGKLKRDDLRSTQLILYSRRSVTFELIQAYLLNQGIRLGTFTEMGSFEAIKELIKLGLGVGVMAPWVARKELESGALVAVSIRPKLKRTWAILTLANRPLRLAEETFVGLSQAASSNLSIFPEI
jgi:LysR family transcriptional regulator, low CO2-responsive transcriptional regulator